MWAAIATANGISAWFLPTDVEERESGAIVTHMGEIDSPGTITGWDPPRRLEYAEPEWAALTGHDVDSVIPLVSEFLVEAKSGGTCVVRVVTSAFGTGADWEREFMTDLEKNWLPFFDNLRLYLTHFPGQRATSLEVTADVSGAAAPVALGHS
ncbi:MAG: SRPBCC family protein [Egibacteraceae bacterium]